MFRQVDHANVASQHQSITAASLLCNKWFHLVWWVEKLFRPDLAKAPIILLTLRHLPPSAPDGDHVQM